ncbi:GtrA family protein [Bacillus paralicheniformis]|uniref:GtrA family protein n=2 Tax=Bacillus paralicheniformis TaxID=1648923 RepID=A0AAW6KCQ2_9BACI|nr:MULTISPECIES: GtrA family protein [Bacillus]ETB71854.1 sugar translocase in surface polysaccharides biosynthesis [Bacillus sp. CPSM8]KJD54448.1 polysaccharide biosynthesis protein [Bacillus amyloliquefaciens]KUL13217.1 sugar translocase in surface polysaccharides biosynthesis [Bacillus licheniformis LMG 7559]KUL15114.1 sugar translocase in surface polysaccharides biosynthesis [Bacillus licheniformis LMG 6934]MBC8625009.1 GtrA family protein [Robertmurraya crescens]POO77023.1 GtrA family pr
MEKLMKIVNPEFIRFAVVGAVNTLNYYAVYLLLHVLLQLNYMVSHIAAFFVSLVISFFLNCYFTFKIKPTLAKFLQFPLTQLFNLTVSSLFVYTFVNFFKMNSEAAPLASMFLTVPLTFLVTGKILKKDRGRV